jgi:hypothetical protein
MEFLSNANVTHVSYILILYSISFLLYLFVNILLHIFAVHTWPDDESNGRRTDNSRSASVAPIPRSTGATPMLGHQKRFSASMNGSASAAPNGTVRIPRHRTTDSQQVRDAEEFELEGLISDDDGGETHGPKDVEMPLERV